MELHITGRHVSVTEAIRSYIEKKIVKLEKFSHHIISVSVVLHVERFGQVVEIQVRGKDLNIIIKDTESDLYAAFDKAMDRMVLAIERREEKIKGRKRARRKARASAKMGFSSPEIIAEAMGPKIVKSEEILQAMTIQEAALTLTNHDDQSFIVFENIETEQLNVLYKNENEQIIWVEPR